MDTSAFRAESKWLRQHLEPIPNGYGGIWIRLKMDKAAFGFVSKWIRRHLDLVPNGYVGI
jgi:hypothetical protein